MRYTLQWHITHRCNLRCQHCYQEEYESFAEYRALLEVLDKYCRFLERHGHEGQINLTGGEPLTSRNFFPLCREIAARGIPFSILTNGTLIDDRTALRIAALSPLFVQVSIDGTEHTHDRIRGRGTYEMAFRGIDALRRFGVPVLVAFTAQKGNRHQLAEVAEECIRHDVNLLWWDRVVTENGESRKKLALTTPQFQRLVRQSGRLHRRYRRPDGKSPVGCGRSLQFLACPENPGYVCSAGKSLVAITADGSVMPCRRLPHVIGNIRDGELDEILGASPLIREINAAPVPEECAGCRHLEKCGGGSRCVTFGQTGELFAGDVNCRLKKQKQ